MFSHARTAAHARMLSPLPSLSSHNLVHFMLFFRCIRAAIEDGTFTDACAVFESQYSVRIIPPLPSTQEDVEPQQPMIPCASESVVVTVA